MDEEHAAEYFKQVSRLHDLVARAAPTDGRLDAEKVLELAAKMGFPLDDMDEYEAAMAEMGATDDEFSVETFEFEAWWKRRAFPPRNDDTQPQPASQPVAAERDQHRDSEGIAARYRIPDQPEVLIPKYTQAARAPAPASAPKAALPTETGQLFSNLDTNGDGVVDADELSAMDRNGDGKVDARDFTDNPALINISELTDALAFQDEARTACSSACVFFLFSLIYIFVLDIQFQTTDSFYISQALRDFVEDIDAGEPGDPLTMDDIMEGEDLLMWIQNGLVDAVFSDTKYNDEKMALWERNYLATFNKVIGGIFLLQSRGLRSDMRSCGTKFGQFYPACYAEDGEQQPFGPQCEYRVTTPHTSLVCFDPHQDLSN